MSSQNLEGTSKSRFLIVSGLVVFLLASVAAYLIAALLRRSGIYWGGALALFYLVIAFGSTIRVGKGTTQLLSPVGQPARPLSIGIGIAVSAVLSVAGLIVALIIGLLGSRGGVSG